MPDATATVTPVNTNAAPAADPTAGAPVFSASPSAVPDLSALTQPGQYQPNSRDAALGSAAQDAANIQTATQQAADIANKPVPIAPTPGVATGPHATLINMISGLALGADAFGKAIATHGREGGVGEVEADIQQKQAAQQRAQEALNAQKNFDLQTKLTTASTNEQLMRTHMLLATLPQDLQLKDLDVTAKKTAVAQEQANLANTTAELVTNYGVTPDQLNKITSGQNVDDPEAVKGLRTYATQKVAAAGQILPADNTALVDAQKMLADPKASAKDIFGAVATVNRQMGIQNQVSKATQEQLAGLPKNQQEAAIQYSAAQDSGDPNRIKKAKDNLDAVNKVVEDEHTFASNLQRQNNEANKAITQANDLAKKGIDDTNKLWTDPQHGFSQTAAQVGATKNAIAAAKNGNELAASLEPAMVTLGVNSFAGVHRISPTEYEAAGPQVGSLYRRLNALLEKAGSGKVPADTLAEANQIMDQLLQAKYQSSLASTRQIVANSGMTPNTVFVPDPNNFGTLTTLDKIGGQSNPPKTSVANPSAVPGLVIH